jgi:hypothetical protein
VEIDFASLMEPVAARLLGEPNKRLSKPPKDLRYGTRGSLSIDPAAGCYFDHENQRGGGVIDFVQAQLECDHASAIAWLKREGFIPEPQPIKPLVIAKYDYADENGELLFRVYRFEPKDFRPRRPDGKWTLEGVRRVLYRLRELIAAIAAGELVFICEGEKDADSVRKFGFAATTNAGGANKWRGEYSESLRSADVVLLPHNDKPGRDHVEHVAAALNGIARRIRILDIAEHWSRCPPKGDISDWIAAGGTADKLKVLVEALPDWSSKFAIRSFAVAGHGRSRFLWPRG